MYKKLVRWIVRNMLSIILVFSFLCIAANGFLAEPWDTLLFLVAIPLLIQLYKIYRDNGGSPLSKLALQVIALVLSLAFTALNGGFILDWPAFPIWDGQLVPFIGLVIVWAGEALAVVVVAFGTMQALYELVYKRVLETIGAAPAKKVESRKEVGFWA